MAKVQKSNMTQTDDKGRVTREAKTSEEAGGQNFNWWKAHLSKMAQDIAGTIKFISTHQSNRIEQLTVSTRLYASSSAFNLLGTAFTRSSSVTTNPMSDRISYNLIASAIDTLVSKMAKNKVLPTFITNGGDWDVQKKAEDLTKFAQGWAYGVNLHAVQMQKWCDATTWGDGFTYVYRSKDKCVIDRVLPHELFVDIVESMCTSPQSMHYVKIMDRDVACDLWPDFEKEIMEANPANYQQIGGQGTAANLVVITHSWHLKSGEDAKDGVHAICIGDTVLNPDDLEYDKDYFPFPKLPYVRRPMGWYSQGVAERLQKIQGEINRGMITIQKSHWLQAGPKIAISNTSKIVSQHLSNELGTIIKHAPGEPPVYLIPPIIQPEVYQWVDSLIEKGLKQEGISEMSATGEKPLGVDSGKAMRTLTEIEDARFEYMQQNVIDDTLETVRQAIEVVKDIYKDKKTYNVVFPSTSFIETIDWKDVAMEKNQYVLKEYPTSSLSNDLTGRLSDVQELAQAGYIDPDTAQDLMDIPDVEMRSSLQNGARDLLKMILGNILKDGDIDPDYLPDATMNLPLAAKLVIQYINYGRCRKAPRENIQALEDWNNQLQDLIQQGMAQAQPISQGPAPANPTPPPVSQLVPNVNQGAAQ
jgi:hypothetical protein